MSIHNIDQPTAEKVYQVLVKEGGAINSLRESYHFVTYVHSYDHTYVEWCFQGLLGRGGKFRITPTDWHVSCYTEDWNMYHQMIIDTINPLLKTIRDGYLQSLSSTTSTESEA